MNAPAFLDELTTAGVRLSLAGDDIRFETAPGVSVAPFRERIVASKSVLVSELRLRQRIIAAVTVEPSAFDRAVYDDLWREWHALNAKEHTA